MGDRTPAGPPMSVVTQPGQRRRGASPQASVAPARSRIAMSAAGTRPIILTSMVLIARRVCALTTQNPANKVVVPGGRYLR